MTRYAPCMLCGGLTRTRDGYWRHEQPEVDRRHPARPMLDHATKLDGSIPTATRRRLAQEQHASWQRQVQLQEERRLLSELRALAEPEELYVLPMDACVICAQETYWDATRLDWSHLVRPVDGHEALVRLPPPDGALDRPARPWSVAMVAVLLLVASACLVAFLPFLPAGLLGLAVVAVALLLFSFVVIAGQWAGYSRSRTLKGSP